MMLFKIHRTAGIVPEFLILGVADVNGLLESMDDSGVGGTFYRIQFGNQVRKDVIRYIPWHTIRDIEQAPSLEYTK